MPHAAATPAARKHRSPAQCAALLSRFECSGQSVSAFCAQESISVANLYRQRGLHRGAVPDEAVGSDTPCFVDLGALRAGAGTRFEIKLELADGGRLIFDQVDENIGVEQILRNTTLG